MAAEKIIILVVLVTMMVQVFGENDEQNCPPEWSIVHQCWKSFERQYKQFTNETAINLRQEEVGEMCLCMSKAVNQVVTNAIVEITA